jgi:ketosteroid isomerase-like protein
MSQDRVQVVRAIWAEWAKGNMSAAVELFDPEIRFVSFMPDAREQVVARGPAGVEEFMREFLRHWRDYRLIADEVSELGDNGVLVSGRQAATGRQSGVAVEDRMYSAWIFRGDRVVCLTFDRDRDAAIEAARPETEP